MCHVKSHILRVKSHIRFISYHIIHLCLGKGNILQGTRGARNPKLQVLLHTHVTYMYVASFVWTSLKTNGMHRKQSEHEYLDLLSILVI